MTVLLPARSRVVAVCVLACCAILVGVVGAVIIRLAAAQRLDTAVSLAVVRAVSRYQTPLNLVAGLGEKADVAVVCVVLVGLCLARRRLNGALLAAIAMPVAPALTEYVLKPLFAQPALNDSFPSGHTTTAFAVATVISVLLVTPGQRVSGRWRLAIAVGAQLAAFAVGVAVIGLSMHTPLEALGGAAVGTGVALSVALLLDLPLAVRLLTPATAALSALLRRFSGDPVRPGAAGPASASSADLTAGER
jgi:membrane-associated phospholipid phosphatase